MDQFVDVLSSYALPLLLGLLAIVLATLALAGRLFERYGDRLWQQASRLWARAMALPTLVRLRERWPWLWRFLGHRLDPDKYLGLHFTLGLLLVLIALQAFVELAEAVRAEGRLAAFDVALVSALAEKAPRWLLTLFSMLTHLGDLAVLVAVGVVVGLALLWMQRRPLLITWVVALAGGGLLNRGLKLFFQRARPELLNPFYTATGWSFPSGHAMGSLIVYGMLAYLLTRQLPQRYHFMAVGPLVTLVLLIGASRVYLGVHYPSDILAGYVAATAWLTICLTGAEVVRRRFGRGTAAPADNVEPRRPHAPNEVAPPR